MAEEYRGACCRAGSGAGDDLGSVGDREADGFEWFAMARPVGVEWLVRASWNRVVESEHRHWWETLQASREAGTVELKGPRRPGKPPRTCPLSVRHQRLTIPAPRTRKPLGEVHLWGILATEISPPDGETPIEGLLLTSVPTSCLDEAIERLHGYSCRWRIEVWHRVLKTGGRIESRPLETIERLSGALTLYSIVAWRIL